MINPQQPSYPRSIHSSRCEDAGRFQAPMSLSREPCTVLQPGELLSRLPTVIKTYSKKSGSSAKCRSNDSPFITSALPQDLHNTISATKSNHNDLSAAGESPKGPVSKPICLSLVPKQVQQPYPRTYRQ